MSATAANAGCARSNSPVRFSVATGGFTLVELLAALLIVSLLAIMAHRGLSAVYLARDHVHLQTEKWRNVTAFFARFARDVQLAQPKPVRVAPGAMAVAPAWIGRPAGTPDAAALPRVEFSLFGSPEGIDAGRRVAYGLNGKRELELWLWPGLDGAAGTPPVRHTVLSDVGNLDIQYLTPDLKWVDTWPTSARDQGLPRAVRLRIVLDTQEEIVRIFALQT
jgi:general secretion pathway protein J